MKECLIFDNGFDVFGVGEGYLGDASAGRLYPARYLPSNPKKWLTGRRATLRTYNENRIEILWLER